MVNKLKYLVHDAGIRRQTLADALGYKHRDYITLLIRGKRRIKPEKQKIIDKLYNDEARKIVIYVDSYVPGSYDEEAFQEIIETGKKPSLKKSAEPFQFKVAEYEGDIEDIDKFISMKSNTQIVKIVKRKDKEELIPYIEGVKNTNSIGVDKFMLQAYDILEDDGDSNFSVDNFIDMIT